MYETVKKSINFGYIAQIEWPLGKDQLPLSGTSQ